MPQKTVVLGISGGIAAYKTPDLVRQLTASGYRVIPVLTTAAEQFVTPMALSAVSGETVRQSLWDEAAERSMGHIELARLADALVVAPATANTLAKFANGIADDLLSTIYTATSQPTLVAPAMNQQMYAHAATQRNLSRLLEDGVHVVGPGTGEQACGDFGAGRMSEPHEIVLAINDLLEQKTAQAPLPGTLADGLKVLVTAGPTRELIDPVRFLTNSSSGRQGFAIAEAARAAGAEVTLVSGPVALDTPPGVHRVDVQSTLEMHDAVHKHLAGCDVMYAVAAVADYKPRSTFDEKIKKTKSDEEEWSLELTETIDIVESVAQVETRPFLVGFAAETHDVLRHAREKRVRKNLDAIVVNDVSDKSIGFDSLENKVTFIHDGGEIDIPHATKEIVADCVVRESLSLLSRLRNEASSNGAAH